MGSHHVSEGSEAERRRGWVDSRLVAFCLVSALVTIGAGLLQVSFGTYSMTVVEAWQAVTDTDVLLNPRAWNAFLLGGELPDMNRRSLIVWNIRLPRVLVGVIVGTTLAVSGAIFQAVTRNELASPFVLGVSSGAGLAVLLTLVVFSGLAPFLPLIASAGGAFAFLLVYSIAWKGGTSPVRLVLAGVVVNMVFQSLQRGMFFLADDLGVVQTALAWITGSLTGTDWEQVRLAIIPATFAMIGAVAGARQLNVLALGERTAQSLGMRVERIRFLMSAVAILAASSAIAVAGIIGFFGLVVPHVVRIVVGSDYRRVIVGCAFAGPALMVAADVGARLGPSFVALSLGVLAVVIAVAVSLAAQIDDEWVDAHVGSDYRLVVGGLTVAGLALLAITGFGSSVAVASTQMPVGVVTGVIGGPYFLYLMRRQQSLGDL